MSVFDKAYRDEDEVETDKKKLNRRIPTSLDHLDCLLLKSEITLL